MLKKDFLNKLNSFKQKESIDNGPKNTERLDKTALTDEFKKHSQVKPSGISKFLNELPKNPDLSKHTWKSRYSMADIHKKLLMEAAQPNVFRLNIEPIVLDKMHGKFKITRAQQKVLFELLYPNANSKITLKIEIQGVEDRIIEIGLENENYTKNFANFIIRNVDEMLAEKQQMGHSQDPYSVDSEETVAGKSYVSPTIITGNSPIWESIIMEADEEEDKEEDVGGLEAFDLGSEAKEPNSEDEFGFDKDDFSLQPGETKIGGFDDFSPSAEESSDINKDETGTPAGTKEDAPEYMEFRQKSDWMIDSLNSMQRLTAKDTAEKMKAGSGVVLTQSEILNGMPGIKGDQNYDIIDKFLKVYPELDGVPITVDMLNEIEDKLALDDGQFDSWLQAKLPEITGTEEVDETLDNEMFEEFKPMGGEIKKTPIGTNPEDVSGEDESLVDFLSNMRETGDTITDKDKELREKAEEKVGNKITNEFPNLT